MYSIEVLNSKPAVILGEEPVIAKTATIRESRLGRYTEVADHCSINQSTIDDYSYVGERTGIIYVKIGKFVSIASDVRINPGNHPMDWVTQHHFMYRRRRYGFAETNDRSVFGWRGMQPVRIGHDVWIGHGAIILPGVTIGNGAVVGSGSVVTRDVAPYSIVAGNSATHIRYRFPAGIQEALEAISWYHWDHETLKTRLDDFRDIRRFLEKYAPLDQKQGDDRNNKSGRVL